VNSGYTPSRDGCKSDRKLGAEAIRFLWKRGDEDISLKLSVHPDTERKFDSLKVAKYGSVAGPICRFILDKLNHYAESVDKTDVIPLKVCAYCSKIMFFEKSSRNTCSDTCRMAMRRKDL